MLFLIKMNDELISKTDTLEELANIANNKEIEVEYNDNNIEDYKNQNKLMKPEESLSNNNDNKNDSTSTNNFFTSSLTSSNNKTSFITQEDKLSSNNSETATSIYTNTKTDSNKTDIFSNTKDNGRSDYINKEKNNFLTSDVDKIISTTVSNSNKGNKDKFSFIKKKNKLDDRVNTENALSAEIIQVNDNNENGANTIIENKNSFLKTNLTNNSTISINSGGSNIDLFNRNRNNKPTATGFLVKDYSELNFVKETNQTDITDSSTKSNDIIDDLYIKRNYCFGFISTSCSVAFKKIKTIIGTNYDLNDKEIEALRKLDFKCSESYDSDNKAHEDLLNSLVDPRRKIAYENLGFQVCLLFFI